MASVADKTKATQECWQLPQRAAGVDEPTLKVYNSLTRSKVEFVTKTPGVVTWYNCGPTVYDASHMGHARNYMTQDIMRRILRDYFGYEVHFVMNITDVDDKIILRARQSHLIDAFLAPHLASASPLNASLLGELKSAWAAFAVSTYTPFLASAPNGSSYEDAVAVWAEISERENDAAWAADRRKQVEKWSMWLSAVGGGKAALEAAEKQIGAGQTSAENLSAVVEANRDALGKILDKKLGATVTDPKIFRELAAYWEGSFFESMAALRVERPTTLTRVSEYIPEIVSFVEGIIARGMAYEKDGNVWFDTAKFEGAEGETGWKHTYAKLQPWSKGNRELLEDGEGSLTESSGKRSAADFALWKTSKPGEPAWPSNWGAGRPGWHIECSVMASAVLGENMDVHSGGEDLAFPHHDNEIAQSEAFHNCRQWVNYFLHTGHLHIEGLKMSKSLKNFITIDQALEKYSARQLRFAFMSQAWHARLDFKETTMEEIRAYEGFLNNFFAVVAGLARRAKADELVSDGQHHFGPQELALLAELSKSQVAFRDALCDSFNTVRALQLIRDLVSTANIYIAQGPTKVNVSVLRAVEDWVTRMLRMFGLGEGAPTDSNGTRVIGWGEAAPAGEAGEANKEQVLMPYLEALSTFRDQVRKLAMAGAPLSDILGVCDQLRDSDLVELGVALDDQEDGRALVKLVPPEQLRAARDAKLAQAADKAARKAASAAAAEAKRLEKLEKGRLAPREMFKGEKGAEFGEWDAEGIPTKDKAGEELPKSRRKKLQKEWDAQKKLHDDFLKETNKAQ